MIKKIAFVLISVAITTAFIAFTSKPKEDKLTLKTQEKEYVGKGTIQDWQILLSNQDDVPKNQRDRVVSKFALQINQQLTDSLPKKK